ncbi:rhodanese-like domain-containing protein [Corynebacterium sp. NPDC060344]|uniref:rhodanese-like domain-containing protein n=1 Tax=Corynebacterium sp. NPDC060344 TaxID=3347101 RepID=UPI00365ECD21
MTTVVDVSPDQLDNLIASGCALVDIRGAEDFAEGHIPGAVNIPANQLKADPAQLVALLDDDAAAPAIALVCMRGHTSRRVADELVGAPAFADEPKLAELDVLNSLDGGTVAWERAGHTLEQ